MHRYRGRLLALVITMSIIMASASAVVAAQPAAAADCSTFDRPLLKRVNPQSSANLLTLSANEASRAHERYGFTVNEGVLAKVADSGEAGLTRVWRLYKSGDFVWATEGADANYYTERGYQRQHVEFSAATAPRACLVAVDRYYRGGKRRMATGAQGAALLRAGWTRSKTVFYAAGASAAAGTDTKFTLAVVPDTQQEVVSRGDTRFRHRATWLAENKSGLDLRFMVQIGDLVNWGHVQPAQFAMVSRDIRPLEAVLPWAGAIGNHDTAAVCVGGSACPGANARRTIRNTTEYNRAFPTSRFSRLGGTFEPRKVDNAYHTFNAGGVDWMVLTLELWPRPEAVAWASSVVASHPKHNVVVVTHAYLEGDGSIGTTNGGYGATSPRYLFDNLVRDYPNVKLVLSGHVGRAGSRTDTGAHGNRILSLLQTYHSGATNPVRLLEIDTAAGTVTSRVYAPYTKSEFPGDSTSTSGFTFSR